MNEGYANEAETTTTDRATHDRKAEQARARRARASERREALPILNEMNVLKVQKAVGRAKRSTTTATKYGRVRTYRIGQNVASMCSWLLFWEGKGELDGDWIHKSLTEWLEETELTESMIRTARRIGKEEGLWEEGEHLRSDDRRVVKYRLNLARMLQIATNSEIENVEARLVRARNRPSKRAELKRELEKLEAVRDEMGLFDAPPEPSARGCARPTGGCPSEGNEEVLAPAPATSTTHPCEYNGGSGLTSPDYRGVPQRSTAEEYRRGCCLQQPLSWRGEGVACFAYDALAANKRRRLHGLHGQQRSLRLGGGLAKSIRGDGVGQGARDALHGRLSELMRGGDTTTVEGFPFEGLSRFLRGFVPAEPDMGEEEFAGIVWEVLDEVRAEHERQREAANERGRPQAPGGPQNGH